jgi:uncharacterized DUF497 family protein
MADEYEWDEAKNDANIEKHGIDFRDAVSVFGRPSLLYAEPERSGEARLHYIGDLDGVIVSIVATRRGAKTRIISARVAHRNERRAYVRFTDELDANPGDEPGRGR